MKRLTKKIFTPHLWCWVVTLSLVSACNRAVILYEEDPTLLTTTFYMVARTGSIDDPKDKTGIAYLLGELMLRGTEKRGRSEFQQEIERLGGSLGVTTSHDGIAFVGSVIAENTDAFLNLVEETILHPKFDEKEFAALKKEVLADIAHAKNRNTRLGGLALRKTMFSGTALERPVIGGLSTVTPIGREELITRYRSGFNQENLFFAVASPKKETIVKRRLNAMWKQFPKGKRVKQQTIEPQVSQGNKLIVVNKPKTATGTILMGRPGIVAIEPDRYALGVGNFSFGGEPLISRLFRIVRSELGWTYAIGSTYNALGGLSAQKGLYMIYSTPSIEFTSKTLQKTLSLWDSYMKDALDKNELLLAKESLVNSYPFEFDSARKRLGLKTTSYKYDIPILSPKEYAGTIGKIENKTILQALKKHHAETPWLISIVADIKEIRKQLKTSQAKIPKEKRLTISKVFDPDEVIQ